MSALHEGSPRRGGRDGFTIIEVIVAIIILAVGVLGLASTATVVTRQIGGGSQQGTAANLAASRFERMRARVCTTLASGGPTVTNGINERWFVTAVNDARLVRDSVWYDTTRGERFFVFETTIPCPNS
jgi:type IV pilus modification protein PilV